MFGRIRDITWEKNDLYAYDIKVINNISLVNFKHEFEID